jgi:hypothetical protein
MLLYELIKKYFRGWQIAFGKPLKNIADIKYLRFADFFLEKNDKFIWIEYDGQHHFFPTRYGGMSIFKAKKLFKKQKIKDKMDKKIAKTNKWKLFRIPYYSNIERAIKKISLSINSPFCHP